MIRQVVCTILWRAFAQNSPTQASEISEPWTSRCSNWFKKRQSNQGSNCQHLLDHWKSKRVPEKHLLLLYDYAKAFDCVDHNKLWKILKEMGIPDHLTSSWEICMQVKKQQLKLDMEQRTSSKLGKEYIKAVYCHPAYLTYMQSTSWETLGWRKHKLESRLPGEISITSDKQMTPLR